MKNQLTPFMYGRFQVRTLTLQNEPWFVAKDVCEVLELKNPTMALQSLEEDERAKFNLGRQGETNIINEPGLYNLIFNSRKPEAKQFRRWINHEVIPSIRKHGAYMTESTINKVVTDPNFLIQLGQTLKTEQEARKAAEQKVAEQQQKLKEQETPVAIYNLAISANNTLSMLEVSKSLGLGRTTLYKILRAEGIIMKDSTMPYQRYLDSGYFKVVERPRASGDTIINDPATRVTAKGFDYIARLLQKRAERKSGLGVEA